MVGEWRKQKNLTLQQLAENAGVSAAYISQIEHSKASPSIATLKNLARALDRPVVDFFIDELVNDPVVMHEDQWTQVNMPEWKANVRQLVRIVGNKYMQPFYTEIEPGGGSLKSYTHPGEEFGFVLEGELTLTVKEDVYKVGAMTSFYYSSLAPHCWRNFGEKKCRVIWVVCPPSW